MYRDRSTLPHSSSYGEIAPERTKDKSLMNLKRSHSAMSSNNNREEVDEVQFRDDQGEVVIEGRGRGSGREGSSVTAADEEEH
ncbi:hypothetical protein ACHAXH_000540, partial [Discostella pseudostelligera]